MRMAYRKIDHYKEWTPWFAWFPVIATSGNQKYRVWLETVWRKKVAFLGCYDSISWWEYNIASEKLSCTRRNHDKIRHSPDRG